MKLDVFELSGAAILILTGVLMVAGVVEAIAEPERVSRPLLAAGPPDPATAVA